MATLPLASLAAQISATGVTAPAYADILETLKINFKSIYGEDAYLEADSQDGQLLAIFARALHDCNNTAVSVYNSFSPQTAFGAGLSGVVKINHMQRLVPTNSQVNVTLTGQAGTTIISGILGDADGQKWLLPGTVTIPPAGTILVTAVAQNLGALQAPIASVTRILTPVAGWQAASNGTAATPGQPVESDAALRRRQELSPASNSYTVLQGMSAALLALPGVTYGTIYENDTDTVDGNGLPKHSIAVVVAGGIAQDVAKTIYGRKAPGVDTYGSTTIPVTDISGTVRDIKFSIPTEVSLKVTISLTPGVNYTTSIGTAIKQAIANYINALSIGEDLVVNRLYGPALLGGSVESETYKIGSILSNILSGTVGASDIPIAFQAKAICTVSNVTITLL